MAYNPMSSFFAIFLSLFFYLAPLSAKEGIALANTYQNNSSLQWKWALDSLEKFPFDKEDRVLDVGCGDGKITALIAEQIPQGIVIGLDTSQEMLFYASSKFSHKNLLFIHGKAQAIPFKQQFDKLVCFSTLHWVLEQKQALLSLKNSLKSGGSLLLVVPGKTPSSIGSISEKLIRSEKWSAYFPNFKPERVYYNPDEYLVLLKEVGLEVQSFEASETITKYKDKTALIGYLRPLLNFIDHLSPNLQEDFINDMAINQIQKLEVFPDGAIGLKTIKIEVIALNPKEI